MRATALSGSWSSWIGAIEVAEVLAELERLGGGEDVAGEIGRGIGREGDLEIAVADHVPEDAKLELRGAFGRAELAGVVTAAVEAVGFA